jgi:hypothetical protein
MDILITVVKKTFSIFLGWVVLLLSVYLDGYLISLLKDNNSITFNLLLASIPPLFAGTITGWFSRSRGYIWSFIMIIPAVLIVSILDIFGNMDNPAADKTKLYIVIIMWLFISALAGSLGERLYKKFGQTGTSTSRLSKKII